MVKTCAEMVKMVHGQNIVWAIWPDQGILAMLWSKGVVEKRGQKARSKSARSKSAVKKRGQKEWSKSVVKKRVADYLRHGPVKL